MLLGTNCFGKVFGCLSIVGALSFRGKASRKLLIQGLLLMWRSWLRSFPKLHKLDSMLTRWLDGCMFAAL